MLLFIEKIPLRQSERNWCFNTSHVTLYLEAEDNRQNRRMFQYISCYSLSNYDKLSDAWDYCFNTSHVTLYLIVNCYRLPSIMFQYISCYSLSFCLMYRPIFFDRFNTSHVTLYPFGHHFLF